ncbi:unnamed protein product [Coccothraustes coccothraustes]
MKTTCQSQTFTFSQMGGTGFTLPASADSELPRIPLGFRQTRGVGFTPRSTIALSSTLSPMRRAIQ